jgi:cytochrome c oxidase assembly protein subunit 15
LRQCRPCGSGCSRSPACAFAIAVVGAITRLTESGLSMVEWKPLLQDIPPLTDAQWQAVFGKYQASPQYLQVNHGMTLAEYQGIFGGNGRTG